MTKTLSVMGREVGLSALQSRKMYAVVTVRSADLRTDAGIYIGYITVETTTDDYTQAVRRLGDAKPGLGAHAFIVRIEDSVVIL